MKIRSIIIWTIIMVFLSSCHKDFEENETISTTSNPPQIFNEINGSVLGYVYDENNLPVADVNITIYSESTTTDTNGAFVMKGVALDEQGTYIKATKNGYLLGSDLIYPDKNTNFSYIKMLKLHITGSFESQNGGKINVEGGGEINFPSNSISKLDGTIYNGTVNVTAKRLSPEDKNLADVMPGGLIGFSDEGKTVVLGTLGMVAVELRDANGNELNLAAGSKAQITFPITNSHQATAPATIDLWSFDEDKGIWIQEGFASKVDNVYIAEVSHFSFWNCDAPFPLIHMCVKLVFEDGTPAPNYLVQILAGNLGVGWAYSNSEGVVCGKIPKNQNLTIQVYDPWCNQIIYTEQIGPFDNNVQLDDIVIYTNDVMIEGQVTCLNEPLQEAYIIVNSNGNTSIINVNEDGSFVLDYSTGLCNSLGNISLFAVNTSTGEASPTLQIDLNAGNQSVVLETCADCDFTVDLILADSTPCASESTYEVDVDGGSGDFTYQWTNGSNDQTVTLPNGIHCVTVTDNTLECEVIKCVEINNASEFFLSLTAQNAICGMDNGSIIAVTSLNVNDISWTVNGVYWGVSGPIFLENLAPGVYEIQAETTNGCIQVDLVEIIDAGELEVYIEIEYNCFGDLYLFTWTNNATQFSSVLWTDPLGNTYSNNSLELNNAVSGDYCVEIVDFSGCTASSCLFVDTNSPLIFDNNPTCSDYFYSYDIPDFSPVTYSFSLNGNILPIDWSTFSFNFNYILWGNTFEVLVEDNINGCTAVETIVLPSFDGLQINNVSPATNDVSMDGSIDAELNIAGICTDCQIGSLVILSWNDEEFINVTANNGSYTSGVYYVVALDINGCPVASQTIDL